jgi:predicted transcriptional regulator
MFCVTNSNDATSSGIENMCSSKHAGVQADNYFGGVSKDLTCCNRGGKSILTVSQTTSHATSKLHRRCAQDNPRHARDGS